MLSAAWLNEHLPRKPLNLSSSSSLSSLIANTTHISNTRAHDSHHHRRCCWISSSEQKERRTSMSQTQYVNFVCYDVSARNICTYADRKRHWTMMMYLDGISSCLSFNWAHHEHVYALWAPLSSELHQIRSSAYQTMHKQPYNNRAPLMLRRYAKRCSPKQPVSSQAHVKRRRALLPIVYLTGKVLYAIYVSRVNARNRSKRGKHETKGGAAFGTNRTICEHSSMYLCVPNYQIKMCKLTCAQLNWMLMPLTHGAIWISERSAQFNTYAGRKTTVMAMRWLMVWL